MGPSIVLKHASCAKLGLLAQNEPAVRFDGCDLTTKFRIDKLMEQLSAHALSSWDTQDRFRAVAAKRDVHKPWPCLTSRTLRMAWVPGQQWACSPSSSRATSYQISSTCVQRRPYAAFTFSRQACNNGSV